VCLLEVLVPTFAHVYLDLQINQYRIKPLLKPKESGKEERNMPSTFNVALTGKSALGSNTFPSGHVCIKKSGFFT